MQKLATQVFIVSSVAFGILGLIIVFTIPDQGGRDSAFDQALLKCFMSTVFIILPSFALSVAGKYLSSDR